MRWGWGMEDKVRRLGIQVIGEPDADPEEVAEATLQLRRELLDLDVGAVETPRAGEAPPGTRAVELLALGGLVLSIAKPEGRCRGLNHRPHWSISDRSGRTANHPN